MASRDDRSIGHDVDGKECRITFFRHPEGGDAFLFKDPASTTSLRCHEAFAAVGAPYDALTRHWKATGRQAKDALEMLGAGRDEKGIRVRTGYGDFLVSPTRLGAVRIQHIGSRMLREAFVRRIAETGIKAADQKFTVWFVGCSVWLTIKNEQADLQGMDLEDHAADGGSDGAAPKRLNPGWDRATTEFEGYHYIFERGTDGKIDRDWYKGHGKWARTPSLLGEYQTFELHGGKKGIFIASNNTLHGILEAMGERKIKPSNIYPMGEDRANAFAEAIRLKHEENSRTLV